MVNFYFVFYGASTVICNLYTNLLIAFSQALPCWTYRSCLLCQTFRQDPRFLAEDFGLFWKTIHPLNWYLSLSIVVLNLLILALHLVLPCFHVSEKVFSNEIIQLFTKDIVNHELPVNINQSFMIFGFQLIFRFLIG